MISTELLLRALHSGYRLFQIPVPHYPRRYGQPTGSHPRVVLRAFYDLWALSRNRKALSQRLPAPTRGTSRS